MVNLNSSEKGILNKEFNIPYEVKVRSDDIIDSTSSLFDVAINGSLMPKEYFLHEFKKTSEIYKFGKNIMKDIDSSKYNLLYVPNKEWYSIFRVVRYNYSLD